jgi:hypothetical protein
LPHTLIDTLAAVRARERAILFFASINMAIAEEQTKIDFKNRFRLFPYLRFFLTFRAPNHIVVKPHQMLPAVTS